MYIDICVYLSLSLYIYIYIHTHIYIYIYIYIYMYTHIWSPHPVQKSHFFAIYCCFNSGGTKRATSANMKFTMKREIEPVRRSFRRRRRCTLTAVARLVPSGQRWNNHVRVLLSFQQPIFQKVTTPQWLLSCTCSHLFRFRWNYEMQVVEIIVRHANSSSSSSSSITIIVTIINIPITYL